MVIDDKVVPWIIAGLGVLIAFITLMRTRKQDCRQEAVTDAGMRVDLEYIKRGVDDIRADQRRLRDEMGTMADRLTRVEESAKQAHKRLDEHIKMHPPD